MTRATYSWLAVVAAIAVGLTGCNGPSIGSQKPSEQAQQNPFSGKPTGQLKTSGFNPSDEVGQSRADLVAGQLADVTVEMDKTNFDPQKFAAQAASGQTPDLIQVDRAIVATLANKDLIIPLDQCYEAGGVAAKEQYYPAVIDDVSYDGKIFGVPQFFQANALLANTRVLVRASTPPSWTPRSRTRSSRRPRSSIRRRTASPPSSVSTATCRVRAPCGSGSSEALPTTTRASPRSTGRRTSRR